MFSQLPIQLGTPAKEQPVVQTETSIIVGQRKRCARTNPILEEGRAFAGTDTVEISAVVGATRHGNVVFEVTEDRHPFECLGQFYMVVKDVLGANGEQSRLIEIRTADVEGHIRRKAFETKRG